MCVQWVETHPQSQRMRLGDMQAKPHQRITKYPLLLKSVLQSTQDPQVQQTLRGMVRNTQIYVLELVFLPPVVHNVRILCSYPASTVFWRASTTT